MLLLSLFVFEILSQEIEYDLLLEDCPIGFRIDNSGFDLYDDSIRFLFKMTADYNYTKAEIEFGGKKFIGEFYEGFENYGTIDFVKGFKREKENFLRAGTYKLGVDVARSKFPKEFTYKLGANSVFGNNGNNQQYFFQAPFNPN
ncbi:hypothetical protein EIN_232670 [Entamoeba invadens IP1]|uniref:Uncharacterized protein n=1 Tax=Entamoeba invadens IP1 TaxID=370355 RepID=L7FML1_ENTIV|nr:hypothetical protein EIN_232670 [Entamoeba invadens IP1]ELP91787.1 hypothetical protein EIN_232670 [Entamoeba invadens IP1]|eukprot:XP_004258558.1 hypothetical protein EIN_232670 [Entamoeba invadens IP1]